MGEERRRYKRVEDVFIVTYRLRSALELTVQAGEREFDAVALDISEGGIGFDSKHELPVGSSARLKFMIRNDSAPLEQHRKRSFDVEAESRYCRPTPEKTFRVGVLFKGLSEADRDFIAAYVEYSALRKYGA